MIRKATRFDVEQICDLAEKALFQRGIAKYGPFDRHTIETFTRFYLRSETGFVEVADSDSVIEGFFVGYIGPWLLDIRHQAIHELLSGGIGTEEMWARFLDWGKQKKAVTAVIGCYDSFDGPRFRRING